MKFKGHSTVPAVPSLQFCKSTENIGKYHAVKLKLSKQWFTGFSSLDPSYLYNNPCYVVLKTIILPTL